MITAETPLDRRSTGILSEIGGEAVMPMVVTVNVGAAAAERPDLVAQVSARRSAPSHRLTGGRDFR